MTREPGPPWLEGPPPPGSWRALFKWGDPGRCPHPPVGFLRRLQEELGLAAADFRAPAGTGLDPARAPAPSRLDPAARAELEILLGSGNVCAGDADRLAAAAGKSTLDLLRLRRGDPGPLPDVVLHPRHRPDLERILDCCARHGLPLVPRGGGSSVTQGLECRRGGAVLDLRTHLHRVLRFSERDQTVTVQPGLAGPRLEALLRRAPELFGAARPYTCGHFPQSFEGSTVGGWAATRGAGQNSTYFGKIEDLVVALEAVTPAGVIRTRDHPAAATGPALAPILLGSEGAFGILSELTLRVFRAHPQGPFRFACLFPDWAAGVEAAREILQGEFGPPSLFRLSDPAETGAALARHGLDRAWLERPLDRLGYRTGRRCLLLGSAEGEPGFARHVRRRAMGICRRHGALPLGGGAAAAWERHRFQDPYLRDDLMDFGILVDTLECAVTWEGLEAVRRAVLDGCRERGRTWALCHLSHAYPQGACLYFTFFAPLCGPDEYVAFQAGLLDRIRARGAALSHHHGIGRSAAPWLEGHLGPPAMALLRSLKRHFDPQGLLNPGGTLGLDLPPEDTR